MIANPIPWPDGARCAVAMTWDMDADSAFNWYNQETADNLVATQQWVRYDPLIAIPRLVEQFAQLELRQTFFVPGWVIEKYPAQIDLLLKNGHEIGLHGYLHERSNEIDKDDEHYWLGRALDAYRKHVGTRPRGWRTPSFAFSKYSLRYLIDAGFEYDSSLMGDDIPYALRDGSDSLLEFPVDWTLDDFPHYAHNRDLGYRMPISSPQRAMEVFRGEFDAAWNSAHSGFRSGTRPVGASRPIQGGPRTSRLHAHEGRRLVRPARPGVRSTAKADGRGALDAALRNCADIPEPAPGILQGTLTRQFRHQSGGKEAANGAPLHTRRIYGSP